MSWGPRGGGPGRRFRRAGLLVISMVVLLVAALATIVASVFAGAEPAPWTVVVVAAVVVSGLFVSARWLWQSTHTVGSLLDAADHVAGGDYTVRVPTAPSRRLRRLTGGFNEMTARLQTNEERRQELLADVAHELRTPLQIIRGTLEGMLDGLYPADPERLKPLLEETLVMARLLDDLRTLSMAEGGVLALYRETVDPRALAQDAARAFRSMAAASGVRIDDEVLGDAPASIDADPVRLNEVLANLLTNAVRHTPAGGRVRVRVSGTRAGGAVFMVDDSGAGIPAERLPFVFDRFVTSADTGGTGLGLAIAKRLVEAHAGTIEAGTSLDGGTRIRFEIPPI